MDMTREEAVQLDLNPNWRALVRELDKVVSSETEHLLHCSPEEVTRLQERVKAFRFLTRLPQIIAEREEDDSSKAILEA